MHELSICLGIIRILEEQASVQDFRKVQVVRVAVGTFAAVDAEALRGCFEIARTGTVAEGARLDVTLVPGEGWCAGCAQAYPADAYLARCPSCPDEFLAVQGGSDLRITEVEVD